MRRTPRSIGALAFGLLALPMVADATDAAVLTGNGRIAFSRAIELDEPPGAGSADIWLMDPDGTDLANLTSSNDRFELEPAWSPDGTRIAFTGVVFDASGIPTSDLWVIDADGSDVRRLTSTPDSDSKPAWSPDGSRIAFVRFDGTTDHELWVIDVDGTDEQQLTDNTANEGDPAWSPDGTTIAYVRDAELWLMDAEGGDRRRLLDLPNSGDPAWSPDGSQIAFEHSTLVSTVPNQIWVVDADGTDASNRSAPPMEGEFDYDPAWSPDGTQIVHTSDRVNNVISIWAMDADGSHRRQLTTSPGFDDNPAWQPVEPPPDDVVAATSTTLTGPQGPPVVGRPVTFEATLAPATATGSVTFADAGVPISGCVAVPVADGRAACTVTWSSLGNHTVVATYGGDDGHAPSTSNPVVVSVQAAPTRLEVARAGYVPMTAVRVSARLVDATTSAGLAGHVVRFTAGSTPVCSAVTSSTGTATCVGGLGARLAVQLRGSYTAAFAGVPGLLPSTGTGPA